MEVIAARLVSKVLDKRGRKFLFLVCLRILVLGAYIYIDPLEEEAARKKRGIFGFIINSYF